MSGGQVHIDTLYAYVALDPADNTEGVVSASTPSGHLPLVGADMAMAARLWPLAQAIAEQTGATIWLLHFTTRTEVDVIKPKEATP